MNTLTPDETILGLLAAEARHGYHLLAAFRDPAQLGLVWDLSTSQLYAVLKRLERQALITGVEVAPADAPVRIEYTLTEAGAYTLAGWLDQAAPSSSVHRVRVEFLSRLYIARLLNLPTTAIVRRQKRVCRERLAEMNVEREQAEPGIGLLAVELGIAQLNAILGWIERCELTDLSDES